MSNLPSRWRRGAAGAGTDLTLASHVPHLYLAGPWRGQELPLDDDQRQHLHKVLRRRQGDPISYTDGDGISGQGVFTGGTVIRGEEILETRDRDLRVAVAPPDDKGRQRFLVEKLAELGVDRLTWLTTKRGEGKPLGPGKAGRWAVSALEQSRSSHLMKVDGEPAKLSDLEGELWVCVSNGEPMPRARGGETLVVGPEGGFSDEEIPAGATRVSLGPSILRVETAALVAAALYLDRFTKFGA